jgi:hypothetical protein
MPTPSCPSFPSFPSLTLKLNDVSLVKVISTLCVVPSRVSVTLEIPTPSLPAALKEVTVSPIFQ